MKEEKITFNLTDENGKEVECEVLFTFESDETKKSYMAYTDYTEDEEGNTKVYASIYQPKEDGTIDDTKPLEPIKTEQEWKIIETILNEIQQEANKEMNNEQ